MSKNQSLTLILPLKMKNFNFSYKFDYIVPCETSLILMEASVTTYNIHHSLVM